MLHLIGIESRRDNGGTEPVDDNAYPAFKDEAQTALFTDPVRTAQKTLLIAVIKTNQFMM